MAVPKRRRSKSKVRMHKAAWKISVPTMYRCDQCGEFAITHNACTICGYYKGKNVLSIKEKKQPAENTPTSDSSNKD